MITVSKKGGDYSTIQEALQSQPYDVPLDILVKEGVYREKLYSDHSRLTIRGEGRVIIVSEEGGADIIDERPKRGTFRSYTALFSGRYVALSGIEIVNESANGQAIALYADADELYASDIVLRSHQDTLFLAPLPEQERESGGFYGPRCFASRRRTRSCFTGSRIYGTVDFIFGSGDAVFRDCGIISIGNGYVSAPSGKEGWDGFEFRNCRFLGENGASECYLMRPWRPEGRASFIGCRIGKHIKGDGYMPWPGRDREGSYILRDCIWED